MPPTCRSAWDRAGRVSGRSRFGATERRVLALVRAARNMVEGPDPVPVPPSSALSPGPSKFAVLGSAGFEIPAYADMFAAFPGWRAQVLRRGSGTVPVGGRRADLAFLQAVGAQARSPTPPVPTPPGGPRRSRWGSGRGLAHDIVPGPCAAVRLRPAHFEAVDSPPAGPETSATDVAALLRRLIGGDDPLATYLQWWPAARRGGTRC